MVSKSFKLDVFGNEIHDFPGDNVHFALGSAALGFLYYASTNARTPMLISPMYRHKTGVAGAFVMEYLQVKKELQIIIQGYEENFLKKSLTVFCCPIMPHILYSFTHF